MIHFIFTEQTPQYMYLKYDNSEDDLWLASCRGKKEKDKHINLTDYINLVNPTCYLKHYKGPEYTEDFIFDYINSRNEKLYYCSIGLWQDIYKFFKTNNVDYDGLPSATDNTNISFFKKTLKHSFEEFKAIVDSWGLSRTPRTYQYEAAYKILQWHRSVSSIATRAGKTLIAYIVFRYCIEYMGMKNVLMIVPAVDLVKQAVGDFAEYKDFFDTEQIHGGGKEVYTSNCTIGTFQSLIKYIEPYTVVKGVKKPNAKYNPHFFDKFDCVFVDEVHRAKAEQIKNILSQPFMKNIKIAFGLTGTLPEEKTIEHYCIFSLLGAKIQTITTKFLKDNGYISDIEIFQYRLHYNDFAKTKQTWLKCVEYALSVYNLDENKKKIELPKEKREFLLKYDKSPSIGVISAKQGILSHSEWSDERKDFEYVDLLKNVISDSTGTNSLAIERMMIHFFNERVNVLLNDVLPKCPKNTLILAHHTEYINYLTDIIKEKYPERHILKITGSISPKKREKIKQDMKDYNDCILVASYGCMSTGITLADLCYGVLFESFKSNIVNMQSIGRGLGLSDEKDKYILYDFVDCFDNEITNKIFLQGLARIKIYQAEENQHKYHICNIDIGNKTDAHDKWKLIKQEHKLELEQQKIEEKKKIKDNVDLTQFQLTFDFDF